MTGLHVADVLKSRPVATMRPQLPVSEAAKRMRTFNVSAVLIVEDGTVVGVLTERDIVNRVVADGRDIDRTAVKKVMTRNPIHVYPDTPVDAAIRTMGELHLRHLPVLGRPDDDGRQEVVGILSLRDAVEHGEPKTAANG